MAERSRDRTRQRPRRLGCRVAPPPREAVPRPVVRHHDRRRLRATAQGSFRDRRLMSRYTTVVCDQCGREGDEGHFLHLERAVHGNEPAELDFHTYACLIEWATFEARHWNAAAK